MVYTIPQPDPEGLVKGWRKRQPAHFMIRVDSFTQLEKSLDDAQVKEFETIQFKADGFTWTLSIFPNGNEDEDAGGYVSMYLKFIEDPVQGTDPIDIMCRFFILDRTRQTFLTIEDPREWRFDELQNKMGIRRALPRNEFTKKDNGFLIGDHCQFGVEVLIITDKPKNSVLSMMVKKTNRIFNWPISSFYTINDPYTTTMSMEGYSWKLVLYKNGNGTGEKTHLSLYLELVDHSKLSNGKSLFANFSFHIRATLGSTEKKLTRVAWFTEKEYTHGFPEFLELSNLRSQNYLDNSGFVAIDFTFNDLFELRG